MIMIHTTHKGKSVDRHHHTFTMQSSPYDKHILINRAAFDSLVQAHNLKYHMALRSTLIDVTIWHEQGAQPTGATGQ